MEQVKKRRMELVVTIVLIAIALTIFGIRIYTSNNNDREVALIEELKAVRTSVQLYASMNKTFPASLKTLTTEKFTMGNKQRLFLTGVQVDNDLFPVDSFGNRFKYDAKTGTVNATTKGYETW